MEPYFRTSARSRYGSFTDEDDFLHQASALTRKKKSNKDLNFMERLRQTTARHLNTKWYNSLIGIVMLTDFCVNYADIDQRAQGSRQGWARIALTLCWLTYFVEILVLIAVFGLKELFSAVFVVDVVVAISGAVDFIAYVASLDVNSVSLTPLRIVRILRIIRALDRFQFLKPLKHLIMMAVSCLDSLFWSIVFLFMTMTLWAMALVEYVNPIMSDVAQTGVWDSSYFTKSCLSSIGRANLFIYQTIVVGDSWGEVPVPVILHAPWTAIFFVGPSLTVTFLVTNVIVGLIVDAFAAYRVSNIKELSEELKEQQEERFAVLLKLLDLIDEDGSGSVTLSEFIEGAKKTPEFQDYLRVMDIDSRDLCTLFDIIDEDKSGSVDNIEFMSVMSRFLTESKAANHFIKYNTETLLRQHDEFRRIITNRFDQLESWYLKPTAAVLAPETPSIGTALCSADGHEINDNSQPRTQVPRRRQRVLSRKVKFESDPPTRVTASERPSQKVAKQQTQLFQTKAQTEPVIVLDLGQPHFFEEQPSPRVPVAFDANCPSSLSSPTVVGKRRSTAPNLRETEKSLPHDPKRNNISETHSDVIICDSSLQVQTVQTQRLHVTCEGADAVVQLQCGQADVIASEILHIERTQLSVDVESIYPQIPTDVHKCNSATPNLCEEVGQQHVQRQLTQFKQDKHTYTEVHKESSASKSSVDTHSNLHPEVAQSTCQRQHARTEDMQLQRSTVTCLPDGTIRIERQSSYFLDGAPARATAESNDDSSKSKRIKKLRNKDLMPEAVDGQNGDATGIICLR